MPHDETGVELTVRFGVPYDELERRADSESVECGETDVSVRSEPSDRLDTCLRDQDKPRSFGDALGSIPFPPLDAPWYRKLASFSGVGFLVAVGYMDPGNWATGLTGGSQFGYTLLFVVLVSSVMAVFLQHLALRLGVAAEMDLAQACRAAWNPWVNGVLFILAEIAIAATDLAEVIGSAIALNLLFGLPIWAGVLITALDCLFLLVFEQRTFRTVELLIAVLTFTIAAIYAAELFICKPDWALLVAGYLPSRQIVLDPAALYVAIGILGATVMPHNLYLHSSIIQTRAYPRTQEGKWAAIQYGTIDATLSLVFAFLINSAILALAAAAFYYGDPPHREVAEIGEAYVLLAPTLSSHAAAVLFGIALLASGQQSTITGTLAGQVVMEGFLDLRMRPWLQRLLTRAVAIVPAVIVAGWMGEAGMNRLLILSQVVLSLQLSFATIPLVYLTSRRSLMGPFVNSRPLAVCGAVLVLFIAALNIYLVVSGARNGSFAL